MRELDLTGTPPSKRDVEEAIAIVERMIVTSMMKIPPELAIQLPNVHRCLKRLLEVEPTYT